jgi:cell division inhibitor SepF
MNLTEMAEADAKRLVDFSAGLAFGLHGSLERVTTAVFLLSPAHVEIAVDTEQAPPRDGFFNG